MANISAIQEIQDLRREMKELSDMVQDNVKKNIAANGHGNVVGFDKQDMQRAARKAGKKVRSLVKQTLKDGAELRDNAEETITTHPFISVAAAVVGGIVAGALFRRL